MALDVKALALTAGLFWAAATFLTALVNLFSPGYGLAFLEAMASLYPGYDGPAGAGSVFVVTLYALVDAAVCGFLFALVYNALAGRGRASKGLA